MGPGASGLRRRRHNAAIKAAETKGPEERRRAARMAAWTREYGKNDAANPHAKPKGGVGSQ